MPHGVANHARPERPGGEGALLLPLGLTAAREAHQQKARDRAQHGEHLEEVGPDQRHQHPLDDAQDGKETLAAGMAGVAGQGDGVL